MDCFTTADDVLRPELTVLPEGLSYSDGSSEDDGGAADMRNSYCGASSKVVTVFQSQRAAIRVPLTDNNGNAVAAQGLTATAEVSVVMGARPVVTVAGQADTAFRADLTAIQTRDAGLYPSSVILRDTDGQIVYVVPFWLEIRSHSGARSRGPVAIAEVRLFLRDNCADANELLAGFEFSDDEIAAALHNPLDVFNTTGAVQTCYNSKTFPRQWRLQWLRAAGGHLLRSAAYRYARNHADVSGTGIRVDRHRKFEHYLAMAKELEAGFLAFAYEEKMRMAFRSGWGSSNSAYYQ